MPPPAPCTLGELGITVAMVAGLELHVPPIMGSFRMVISPTQTLVTPVIGRGNGLTVTTTEVKHPDEGIV